jgi:hypothetical protein
MTFGISPVAGSPFAEQTDDGFPQFIQWQSEGTNLGGPDADVVNITGGLAVTRGVGENANVITIDGPALLSWEDDGSPLADVTTVNIGDGLSAELVSGVLTIAVSGAPPQTFIQWEQDGVPLGDDSVHHVNVLSPGLVATRNSGLGASSIVLVGVPPQWTTQTEDGGNPDVIQVGDNLTMTVQSGNVVRIDGVASYPEWQQGGVDFGNAHRIVVGTGITLSIASGEPDTIQLSVPQFSFSDVAGDHTLQTSDLNNGLSTSGTTGTQNITVPADAQLGGGDLNGKSVLIYVEGAAAVDVLPVSGVNVHVRSGLTAVAAGQYATLTLIHTRHANDWVLCGDLSA